MWWLIIKINCSFRRDIKWRMMSVGCWLCRIAWFCKCQSHFRLSLILFCLLPLVSSDGENKSAEEHAKLVISINLLSRSHLEVKQQFSNSIYRKVTAQVRKQAILTDSPLQFSISGRWDFHHATRVCSGLWTGMPLPGNKREIMWDARQFHPGSKWWFFRISNSFQGAK